ncbi:hypothetical protein CROQUDRAFT_85356 [Cronartium quercuum f. sp. fusiforme G11]|uniref:Uncharacterized protein n=1 Tax=Cronartium quercuum f. sp. fusiforme G11 TaxID=708437 RepID=A0A9P6NU49_9BASI|nr:hypothetical protein CROQUDRAFT_85356 [Cronartium quercuum f. sp. fusiforme G11]
MPDPLNSNCMFVASHQVLVIWAEACVNGLAMLSTPPNNEIFCLEVETGLTLDKETPTEDLIGPNVQGASGQFMANLIIQPQLKPVSPRNPPVFGGFTNEDTDTKSDSRKASSDIEVINQEAYHFKDFLTDAGVNQDDQHTWKVLTDAGFTD